MEDRDAGGHTSKRIRNGVHSSDSYESGEVKIHRCRRPPKRIRLDSEVESSEESESRLRPYHTKYNSSIVKSKSADSGSLLDFDDDDEAILNASLELKSEAEHSCDLRSSSTTNSAGKDQPGDAIVLQTGSGGSIDMNSDDKEASSEPDPARSHGTNRASPQTSSSTNSYNVESYPPISTRHKHRTRLDEIVDQDTEISSTNNEISSICAIDLPRENFTIHVPRPSYPKSQYYSEGIERQSPAVAERETLGSWATKSEELSSNLIDSEQKIYEAKQFTIYRVTDQHTAPRMSYLTHLHSSSRGSQELRLDATIIRDDDENDTVKLIGVPIHKVSTSLEMTESEGEVWVQSRTSEGFDVWYELTSPSDEYQAMWSDFLWLVKFSQYVISFLERPSEFNTNDTFLIDFKKYFYSYHLIMDSAGFASWHFRTGSRDVRQHLSTHWEFIWHVAKDLEVQNSAVFRELRCDLIHKQRWRTDDSTIVTPYVQDCFSHMFGNILKPISTASQQRISHVEIYPRVRSTPKTADWNGTHIHVGDFVYFETLDDSRENSWTHRREKLRLNKSRSAPASAPDSNAHQGDIILEEEPETAPNGPSRDFLYVTEVIREESKTGGTRYKYRGLWCYQPGTWHTQLDTSYYPHRDAELFLSDHCNCEEAFDDHRFATFDEVDGIASVNLETSTNGHDYFCRSLYLHEEGNFCTLLPSHLDPQAAILPCECRTHEMKERQQQNVQFSFPYHVGDTILISLAGLSIASTCSLELPCNRWSTGCISEDNALLEPFLIDKVDESLREVHLIQLTRLQYLYPECLHPHEVLVDARGLGAARLVLHETQLSRAVRRCGLWHVRGDNFSNQLQLHGSGEQFFFRQKFLIVDDSMVITDCEPDDLVCKGIRLETCYQLEGPKLRGLDLFCGAGNLGEGIRDGGVVQYASIVDILSEALHTYQANHAVQQGDDPTFDSQFYLGSVNRYLKADMDARIRHEKLDPIDFIVAGSPCQGFSQANINKNTEASLRNCSLVASFASYVDFYRPKYAVLENVAGLSDNVKLPDGRIVNVHRQLLAMAVGIGYQVRTYTNSAWLHGSAQSRQRTFVIFAAPGLTLPEQPIASHENLPGSIIREKLIGPHGRVYRNSKYEGSTRTFRARTVRHMWEDLPNIDDGPRICISNPYHRFHGTIPNFEQIICRSLGAFARGVKSKVSRSLSKASVKQGPKRGRRHAKTLMEMHEIRAVPQALVAQFPSTCQLGKAFGRIDPERLLGTVLTDPFPRARFGTPCIHYEQPRRYTIAEAKRAQGFLDHDVILGTGAAVMKQIGNSVSRHASYAIGLTIRDAMLKDEELNRAKVLAPASGNDESPRGLDASNVEIDARQE